MIDSFVLYPVLFLIAIVLPIRAWNSKYKRLANVLALSIVLTIIGSVIYAGDEWTITGFACDGACYEKMSAFGFPLIVFHPDGANSVSWFFNGTAFFINFLLIACVVYTVVVLVSRYRSSRLRVVL